MVGRTKRGDAMNNRALKHLAFNEKVINRCGDFNLGMGAKVITTPTYRGSFSSPNLYKEGVTRDEA